MTKDQQVHEIIGLCWHVLSLAQIYDKDKQCRKCASYETRNPSYTTSIADAWKLVEWMMKKHETVSIKMEYKLLLNQWMATLRFFHADTGEIIKTYSAVSKTAPLAIVDAVIAANKED